jgi:hypothetical protein
MTHVKHTPGPWFDVGPDIQAAGGKIIAYCYPSNSVGGGKDIQYANAALIAEAGTVSTECGLPLRELLNQRNELLGALEQILEEHDILSGIHPELSPGPFAKDRWPEAAQKARTAITRAKGRTKPRKSVIPPSFPTREL